MRKVDYFCNKANAVLCALFYLSLLLPFSGSTVIGAVKEKYSYRGLQIVTDNSIWGILLLLAPLVILLLTYLKQLEKFKKIGCLISAMVMVLMMLKISFSFDIGNQHSGFIDSPKIGFWVMLLSSFILAFVSVVPFVFKKNLNTQDINEKSINNFNKEKIDKMKKGAKIVVEKMSDLASGGISSTVGETDDSDELMNKLIKLNELKENGIITEEDFNKKKKEILTDL